MCSVKHVVACQKPFAVSVLPYSRRFASLVPLGQKKAPHHQQTDCLAPSLVLHSPCSLTHAPPSVYTTGLICDRSTRLLGFRPRAYGDT
jgi:hypothetical protein